MRRWFSGLALACGLTGMLVQSSLAQNVQILPVQAQPAQIQRVQVQPAQIQLQLQPAIARIAPQPNIQPAQLTQADAVVVGRVVGMEPQDVEATPAANQPKANYRIAVIQISEVVHGVKQDTKMIRVGFVTAPMNVDPNGAINGIQIQIAPAFPGRRPFPGYGSVNLQVGQDGLFMLAKHHKENFYVVPNYTSFINRQDNPNFDNEVKNAKQLGKVIENTTAALKSDDQQQRYLAAAVLISKYRSNPTGQATKQEPISAEESKLILQALAGANWAAGRVNANIPSAIELFRQLQVANNLQTAQAMQKWLDENKDKYVINKLVVDPNAAQPQPGIIQPGVDPVRPVLPIKKGVPIKGKAKIGILPVRPLPAPIQPIEIDPVQPLPVQPAPLPIRRD